MKYWKVIAKCGHVRKNRYILKTFYIKAINGSEAARIVRGMSRVKHDQKYAIRSVTQIDQEEWKEGLEQNREDPYFSCRSIQEQRRLCEGIDYETFYEEKPEPYRKKTHARKHLIHGQREKEWKKERSMKDYE